MLTACVDLWLNTPRRPYEASGTSGMKEALNGVPSLSILDGWWIEGCVEGFTGWAIPDLDTLKKKSPPSTTGWSQPSFPFTIISSANNGRKSCARPIALNGSFLQYASHAPRNIW